MFFSTLIRNARAAVASVCAATHPNGSFLLQPGQIFASAKILREQIGQLLSCADMAFSLGRYEAFSLFVGLFFLPGEVLECVA